MSSESGGLACKHSACTGPGRSHKREDQVYLSERQTLASGWHPIPFAIPEGEHLLGCSQGLRGVHMPLPMAWGCCAENGGAQDLEVLEDEGSLNKSGLLSPHGGKDAGQANKQRATGRGTWYLRRFQNGGQDLF